MQDVAIFLPTNGCTYKPEVLVFSRCFAPFVRDHSKTFIKWNSAINSIALKLTVLYYFFSLFRFSILNLKEKSEKVNYRKYFSSGKTGMDTKQNEKDVSRWVPNSCRQLDWKLHTFRKQN